MDVCYIVERGLKDAVSEARKLRSEGYSVRVLKSKNSYSIIDCGSGDSGLSPLTTGAGAAVAGGVVGYLVGKAR